jgi:hypothetical protein
MVHEKYTPLVVVAVLLMLLPIQRKSGDWLPQAVEMGLITLFLQLLVLPIQVLVAAERHQHT